MEKQLANLSNNFTEEKGAVRCYTEQEKDEAIEIFNKYYNNVESVEREYNNKQSYIVKYDSPKQLTEESDEEEIEIDLEPEDFDDFLALDDPEDDMDLADLELDTVDDAGEVDDANQLTILKKRAAVIADKWNDIYSQITALAGKLDLIATHDDKLNIELKKMDGKESNIEKDLDTLDKFTKDKEEIDDDFGPSEFDNRADNLQDGPKVDESIEVSQNIQINESSIMSNDPNELPIREDEIDDDF